MRSSRYWAALSLLVVVAGCGPSELELESAHVHLRYLASSPPCPATVEYLSSVAEEQARFLGLPLPASPIIYHYRSNIQDACGDRFGCYHADTGEIFAQAPTSAHELAHALAGASIRGLPAFFSEGLAVALGESWFWQPPDYSGGEAQLLARFDFSAVAYATAGDFVSYLLTAHGSASLIAFLQSIADSPSQAQIDAAFQATYGDTFADEVAARLAAPRAFTESRLWLPECVTPAAAWTGTVAASLPLSCDGGGIGPDAKGAVMRQVTADIPVAGAFALDLETTPAVEVGFHRCTTDGGFRSPLGAPGAANTHARVALELDPGRYSIEGSVDAGSSAPFDVSLAPATDIGTTCAALTPVMLDPTVTDIYAAPASGTLLDEFRVAAPVHRNAFGQSAAVDLCEGTCMESGCPAVAPSAALLDPASTFALAVQAMGANAFGGLHLTP